MTFIQLPQNCADRVFEIIEAEYGVQAIARLRLISKAWLAAVQQYPGTAKDSSKLDKVDALQRIMPNVSKIYITHILEGSPGADLTPLAQCLQLISLDLTAVHWDNRYYNGRVHNVVGVPKTLRELRVIELRLDAESFSSASTSITKLDYQRREPCENDEWEWLLNLPYLKVSLPPRYCKP